MKGTLAALWAAISSRALAPLVIGFFFLLYVGIGFFSDETLTILISLTSRNLFLAGVLGLVPLNLACRVAVELAGYLKRRRALAGACATVEPALYDEGVEISAAPALGELAGRLGAAGYRTRSTGGQLSAWRGVSLSAARVLFLAATFCTFAGILVSLTSRTVSRQSVVEGNPFPSPSGDGGAVERIIFKESRGSILAKDLEIDVAPRGGGIEKLGVYPPTLINGAFAYPRYLGIALSYRFSAPDLPGPYQNSDVFPIYPPGKEAGMAIPGSPYKITLSLQKPQDASDPYMTGQLVILFKLLKGSELLFEGSIPKGGEFVRDGIRLGIQDARRMVVTDFVVDYGVLLIWGAGFLFLLALMLWLPVRLFFPRREMLFHSGPDSVQAWSHAEGGRRKHAGVFHEALDVIAGKLPDSRPAS